MLTEEDLMNDKLIQPLTLLMMETMSSREDKAPYEDSRSMSLADVFCFGSDSDILKKSAMICSRKST